MACYNPDTEEFQSVCRVMSGFSDAFYVKVTSFSFTYFLSDIWYINYNSEYGWNMYYQLKSAVFCFVKLWWNQTSKGDGELSTEIPKNVQKYINKQNGTACESFSRTGLQIQRSLLPELVKKFPSKDEKGS